MAKTFKGFPMTIYAAKMEDGGCGGASEDPTAFTAGEDRRQNTRRRTRAKQIVNARIASPSCWRPKVAEFFAGIGLMRAGLEGAGFRVVWANDIDKQKAQLYAAMRSASQSSTG